MSTPLIATPAGDITLKRLQEVPPRVLAFLRGMGIDPTIQAQLAAVGYTAAVHAEGWSLLWTASGFTPPDGVVATKPVVEAITQLSDDCVTLFHRVHAALFHHHAAQADFVFKDLEASSGAEAILSVGLLLDRLDALESAPDRAATRTDDEAALATLTARGIDKAERARLRALVDQAKATAGTATVAPSMSKLVDALVALRAWYLDWSETAHAVLTKRGDLIKLGLAKRQKRPATDGSVAGSVSGSTSTGAGATPSPTVPAPTPAGPSVTPSAPSPTPAVPSAPLSALIPTAAAPIAQTNGAGAH